MHVVESVPHMYIKEDNEIILPGSQADWKYLMWYNLRVRTQYGGQQNSGKWFLNGFGKNIW